MLYMYTIYNINYDSVYKYKDKYISIQQGPEVSEIMGLF